MLKFQLQKNQRYIKSVSKIIQNLSFTTFTTVKLPPIFYQRPNLRRVRSSIKSGQYFHTNHVHRKTIPILLKSDASPTSSSSSTGEDDDCDIIGGERDDFETVDGPDSQDEDLDVLRIIAIEQETNTTCLAVLEKLLKYKTFDEIFTFIKTNEHELTASDVAKCVLAIWELNKSIKITNSMSEEKNLVQTFDINHPTFELLIEKIDCLIEQMTPDELSICFLYLHKLSLNCKDHFVMDKLIFNCLKKIENHDEETVPLTALSRFCVAVVSAKELYTFLICQKAFGLVVKYLRTIETNDALRLVTICLNSFHQLVSEDILIDYKEKLISLCKDGVLTNEHSKCILKVIQFLNYPHWSQKNTELLRELSLMLIERIEQFQVKELEQVFRVLTSQLEPAELMPIVTKQANTLFQQTPSADILACSVMYALPEKRSQMTDYAKEFIYTKRLDDDSNVSLPTLFKILRFLKISNVYICDGYWSRVLAEIKRNSREQESYILARHCHRYMHFNNNLGGTYRHRDFEKYLVSLLMTELTTGLTAIVPSKFAKAASFVLAYGHTPQSQIMFSNFVINRLEEMHEQFRMVDCLQISRGIQIALQMRYKKFISPQLANQLHRIEIFLNNCTERHLNESNLTVSKLNCILRAYTNRQTSTRTRLFHEIINKYEEIPLLLNSRSIREITFNLNASKFLLPRLCDQLLDYVLKNEKYIFGDTVEKVLYCCYNLGYQPQSNDVLDASVNIIHRDFNFMSGISIVQACLALAFYKHLPETLIGRIFCIDFIKRIEDEIEMCYSKATYPERVLNQVMQLNRAVCLDFPQCSVPWFQQNYIEAQLTKAPVIKNKFQTEIKEMLTSLIVTTPTTQASSSSSSSELVNSTTTSTDASLLKINHVTPYGYRIDFVLHFNQYRRPVSVPRIDGIRENITKVAILLLKMNAFCMNDPSHLRGNEMLRQRHLEMMGYKVIQINYNEWSSMYMGVPGAKIQYLKNILALDAL